MPYTIKFPGGEVSEPDAYSAARQIKYLRRDGHEPCRILNEAGIDITEAELGERALREFKAP